MEYGRQRYDLPASVDGVLYNKDKTTLCCCPAGKSGAFIIPDSVTTIGWYAFTGCTGLTSIEVDANNPSYSSIDGVLYNKERTTLLFCPAAKSGSFMIPNSVTTIGKCTFFYCESLNSITIPDSVTTIANPRLTAFFPYERGVH